MMALNGSHKFAAFCGLQTIIFIVLKLLDHSELSWWWTFSPLWIPAGVIIAAVLLVLIACLAIHWIADTSRALRRWKGKAV